MCLVIEITAISRILIIAMLLNKAVLNDHLQLYQTLVNKVKPYLYILNRHILLQSLSE